MSIRDDVCVFIRLGGSVNCGNTLRLASLIRGVKKQQGLRPLVV